MTLRTGQAVFLVLAVVGLAAVTFGIVSGVSVRRSRRDLIFGLEELDILIADGLYEEADAMLPWLAERVRTAGEGMRVFRRAHELYRANGSTGGMDATARLLLHEFPANTTIRSVAVYAAVRAGRTGEALEIASGELGSAAPVVYAWALLSNRTAPADQPAEEPDEMLLARLGTSSSAQDYERAWRLTGDERYALDAVLLLLLDDPESALDLALAAGLRRTWPLFVADILTDRGRFHEAASLLSGLESARLEVQMRLADVHYHTGNDGEAFRVYETLVDNGIAPATDGATDGAAATPPPEAFINLAHLTSARGGAGAEERSLELLTHASARYPDSWPVARASALARWAAGLEPPELTTWFPTEYEAQARLLALQLEEDPDRRGYEADLWILLERFPSDRSYRYAAWYLYTRERVVEVERVLRRAASLRDDGGPEPAWSQFYRGMLAARTGLWEEAAEHLTASFVLSPSWQSALNATVALTRSGRSEEAQTRLENALLLARHGKGRMRAQVFVAAARLAADAGESRRLLDEAFAIDPSSPDALLLQAQLGMRTRGRLENAGAR